MATTTILTNPDQISPINSIYGNTFVLNNVSSSALNFKYLVKVFANNVFLIQESAPPRPITGQGQYSPQKSLLTQVSYDLPQAITQATEAINSLVYYRIQYGYSYNPNLTIAGIYQVPVGAGYNFGYTFSTAHNLTTGDIITIQTDNPYFSGTSSIIGATFVGENPLVSFVTDRAFSASSSVSTGVISNVYRFNGTSSTFFGYNGTRQYNQVGYNFNAFIMGSSGSSTIQSRPFLTNYNNTTLANAKMIMPTQQETIGFLINTAAFPSLQLTTQVNYYNVNNVSLGTYSGSVTIPRGFTPSIQFWNTTCGPNAGTTLPATTDNYSIKIKFGSSTVYSETRWFRIDNSCSIYDNVRVMFMNRYGAFDYWNFRQDDQQSYNVSRNEYKQELAWNYSIGDRERTILSQKVEETHIINTNWISENDYAFLAELVTSPEVYIVDETTLQAYPIIITDSSYTFKTANRDKIFNLTLSYVMSYSIETQNQ